MGLKRMPAHASAAQPTLDGIANLHEEARETLTRYFLDELHDYLPTRSEKSSHFLARIGLGSAKWLHRMCCTTAKSRRLQSCVHDARAIDHMLGGIALATLHQELHDEVSGLITAAVNATDLTEVQRVDGLAAKFEELLHPHRASRTALDVLDGSPIFQINSAIRDVDRGRYQRNRLTAQDAAPVAEARGFRVDITSDYASPGHPAPGQEYLVRTGVLRAAAIAFIMNGAGPGTGRAIELAMNAMTPILLLRRVTGDEPRPANEDRHSGEVTGLEEYEFATEQQARALVDSFLSSQAERINKRQRILLALERTGLSEEARGVHAADASAFAGAEISVEEARFWVEPLHFPYAGDARKSAIRLAIGMPEPAGNASRRRKETTALTPTDARSRNALHAYARVMGLSEQRTLLLWMERASTGPSPHRRGAPLTFDDWADVDRRTPNK